MKELKDLLKENKYLEAKEFILSNLDKIEECIDDLLGELVDKEPKLSIKFPDKPCIGKSIPLPKTLEGIASIGDENDIVDLDGVNLAQFTNTHVTPHNEE